VANTEPLPAVEFVLDAKHLRAGKNVLAIQGLNAQKSSSDLSLVPSLAGEVAPDPDRDQKFRQAYRVVSRPGAGSSAFPGREAYSEGRVLERAGQFGAAELKFAEAARLDPARVEPVLARGRSLRALGRLEEAEAWYREARDRVLSAEVPLWDAWVVLMLVDLKRPLAAVLASLPLPSVEDAPLGKDTSSRLDYGLDIRWALERLQRREPILIRCGTEAFRDREDRLWGRDRFHGAGFAYGEDIWTPMIPRPPHYYTGDIAKTEDDDLYRRERWFPAEEISRYYYRVPLPPGRYRVVLHCAEVFPRIEPGKRVFGIRLEGKLVRPDYEPLQAGFATADQLPFEVEVADGFLDLGFEPILQNPKLSALEIEPAG
jgi:tetratricopeptide (TPR) repeat protein